MLVLAGCMEFAWPREWWCGIFWLYPLYYLWWEKRSEFLSFLLEVSQWNVIIHSFSMHQANESKTTISISISQTLDLWAKNMVFFEKKCSILPV